jgi:Ankyrin repeats (3 copies)
MAFVAILGPHANILEYCVEQHLQIDNNITWAAANYLNAEILAILFPLNIFGIKSHPEFLEGILDEVLILGKYRGKTTSSADALSLAKFLVKQGAKVTENVIATAAKEQSINFMKYLLLHRNGVDLSECGALHIAVVGKKLEMMMLLLDEGCDPNKMHRNCAVLVDRNTYDDYGYPLNYAVSQRDVDMVRALVAKGANPKLSCDAGHDAFTYLRNDTRAIAGKIRELLNQAVPTKEHIAFGEAIRRE